MFRSLKVLVSKTAYNLITKNVTFASSKVLNTTLTRQLSFQHNNQFFLPTLPSNIISSSLLQSVKNGLVEQNRTVTKFSLKKGKRKTVKAVIKRFKRLHWGMWIHTRSGRHKKLFKKSPALKKRLRQHVFSNATQSWLLDKMVTSFWRRPKYYVDDPYEPYHTREEFFASRKKPVKYYPNETSEKNT